MTLLQLRRGALGAGLAGTVACAIGAIWAPQEFFAAWLAAYVFWLGVPLGALALVEVHDLTGGRWALTVRPGLTASLLTLPLFILVFIPIFFFLPELYSWARPDEAAYLPNTFYLDAPFFIGRFAGYFVIWLILGAIALLRSPLDGDGASGGLGAVSGIGLVLLAFTATFAAFDWVMSLEPHWFSTMFGLIVGSGQFTTGLCVVILVALMAKRMPAPGEGPPSDRFHDLGSILLAVLLLWAYFEFMQFLIIWEEDLRDEIGWYVKRLYGPWGSVMLTIVLGHFVVPFLALIWSPVKRSRGALGAVCALVLVTGLIDVWWMVLPEFPGGFTWFAPVAAMGMGGLALALFLWRFERGLAKAERRIPAPRGVRFERGVSHG